MLLDNKSRPDADTSAVVYDFIKENLDKPGAFDVVTGYFSAAALACLHQGFVGGHLNHYAASTLAPKRSLSIDLLNETAR